MSLTLHFEDLGCVKHEASESFLFFRNNPEKMLYSIVVVLKFCFKKKKKKTHIPKLFQIDFESF